MKHRFISYQTTGLGDNAKLVAITICDELGHILLDTMLNPLCHISSEVKYLYNISDDTVKDSPILSDILPYLENILDNATVITYSITHSQKTLRQALLPYIKNQEAMTFIDLISPFSQLYSEYDEYHQELCWQSLDTACRYYGITPYPIHKTAHDVHLILAVYKRMLEDEIELSEENNFRT